MPGKRLVLSEATVTLKSGREKSLLRRHPWIFSGAIASVAGSPGVGDTVRVNASDGTFLGWGAFSPHSQIRVRIWSWDEEKSVGKDLIHSRISASIASRNPLFSSMGGAQDQRKRCRGSHPLSVARGQGSARPEQPDCTRYPAGPFGGRHEGSR